MTNLLDFCNQYGPYELPYKPVITLTKKSSRTGETQGHAVVLDKYVDDENFLTLMTIDSLSKTGETVITCPILKMTNGQQKLIIGGEVDQWCLGSENCYVFYFN